jgi:hypothetical protein
VVEAETGRAGSEGNPSHAVRWNKGRAFFRSAVYLGGNYLTMPMELLGSVGIVVNFYFGWLGFFEPQ